MADCKKKRRKGKSSPSTTLKHKVSKQERWIRKMEAKAVRHEAKHRRVKAKRIRESIEVLEQRLKDWMKSKKAA